MRHDFQDGMFFVDRDDFGFGPFTAAVHEFDGFAGAYAHHMEMMHFFSFERNRVLERSIDEKSISGHG